LLELPDAAAQQRWLELQASVAPTRSRHRASAANPLRQRDLRIKSFDAFELENLPSADLAAF